MNKHDFIDWLLARFNVSESSYDSLFYKYSKGLIDKLNFSEIKKIIDSNYYNLPSIKEINDFINRKEIIISSKCEALQHIEKIKSISRVEMKDFNEDLKNKIRAFLEKHNKKASFDM